MLGITKLKQKKQLRLLIVLMEKVKSLVKRAVRIITVKF